MLRVAVPNKGSLSESASAVLAEAGYRKRSDSKDLTVLDNTNDVERTHPCRWCHHRDPVRLARLASHSGDGP